MKHPIEPNFANALRSVRRSRGVSQEEFDQVSSRTYVSAIERGLKHPTLNKIAALAGVLNVHPLTLLTASFCTELSVKEAEKLFARVLAELRDLEGIR